MSTWLHRKLGVWTIELIVEWIMYRRDERTSKYSTSSCDFSSGN